MSIIGTALKKTQKIRNTEIKKQDTIKSLFPENVSLKKTFGLKKFKTGWKRSIYIRKSLITAFWVMTIIISISFLRGLIIVHKTSPSPSGKLESKKEPAREKLPAITGIMFSPERPSAIINDILVFEGSNITGFSVLKIFPDRVKLSKNDKEFILTLQ